LAANLAWGTWRFSRADDLARRGPSELGRRVVRTLFSLARKPKPFDVLVYFSAIYKVILPEIEGLDMAIESTPSEEKPEILVSEAQARRDFLKKAGRFAAVTPPAITLLLGTSLNSRAIAKSGGWPGNGWGDKNHIHIGPPGQTGK
jgi:hypothetical protein